MILPHHVIYKTLQYYPDSNIQTEYFTLLLKYTQLFIYTAIYMACVSLFLHKSGPQSQSQWENVLALHTVLLQAPIWSM